MKFVLCGFLACIALSASSRTRIAVHEMLADLSALLDSHASDKTVAKQIEKMDLSESLTSETLRKFLETHQVGPHTAFALDIQAFNATYRPFPPDNVADGEPPDDKTFQAIQSRMNRHVEGLLGQLNRLLCVRSQTFESDRNNGGRPANRWYPVTGRRQKTANSPDRGRVPLGYLQYLPRATLVWDHWQQVASRKTAVMRFIVHRAIGNVARSDVYLQGIVFCSPDDGTIYRLIATVGSSGIGKNRERTQTVQTDFAQLAISNAYELPVRQVALLRVGANDRWLKISTSISDFEKSDAERRNVFELPVPQ